MAASTIKVLPDITVALVDSESITINGKSVGNVTIPASMSGYTPIGIVGIEKNGSGSSNLVFYEYKIQDNNARIYLRNVAESATATVVVTAYVLYKRNI